MAQLAALDPLWRPNETGPTPNDRQDRELIRRYARMPVEQVSLELLTSAMNSVAQLSAPAVAQVQAWIDEIETLETQYAAEVASGEAHLGNAAVYEGLRPGLTPQRGELLDKAGDLEWDVESWAKVRVETGTRAGATSSSVLASRIGTLKQNILDALNLAPDSGADGSFLVIRS